ncbi:MAG: hypothetical protein AAB367_02205 [Patescibacteria group bacterium]
MKLVAQEAPMGCAIACAASLSDLTYKKMRSHFSNGRLKEYTVGFYNKDIVSALSKVNIITKGCSSKRWSQKKYLPGTIVFIKRSKKYSQGHFLLKTPRGWMNPWANYPSINPAKAAFQRRLPGETEWVIVTKKDPKAKV